LAALSREVPELIQNVRGAGVMIAFDVARPDLRDVLRDRAFRLGLILLPAGERALRFYPRYDTEPYALREALEILRTAAAEALGGRAETAAAIGPEIRVGELEYPIASLDAVELTAASFAEHRAAVTAVEVERYGSASSYPGGVVKPGRRPPLQYAPEV